MLPTVNDVEAGTVSADVTAAPAPADGASTMAADRTSLVALAAGPSGAQGTYTATALSPSASWSVATASGGFNWNYPLRTVPTPGGPSPPCGLGYSSQSADGRTSASNNQASWIGEGFSYHPGYIERSLQARARTTATPRPGEQCWRVRQRHVMLNGGPVSWSRTTPPASGAWRSDDGTKVEQLTGAANGDRRRRVLEGHHRRRHPSTTSG